ncbi:hypothetical protein [Burkholderia sp. BCC0405]|uniref:hypothetical protein n=1 Tax=Burkholderia sp. BCC0405 TaxID=2676298 RepID=UPI001588F50F|nr:hypothetical protein [Burkholderia sp. BCC0405]
MLAHQSLVSQFGMTASMSRRGNCYDHAPIESLWGALKGKRLGATSSMFARA